MYVRTIVHSLSKRIEKKFMLSTYKKITDNSRSADICSNVLRCDDFCLRYKQSVGPLPCSNWGPSTERLRRYVSIVYAPCTRLVQTYSAVLDLCAAFFTNRPIADCGQVGREMVFMP